MQTQAANTQKRSTKPFVPVEHLMSNFDEFYSEVVSRQLLKDRASVEKKYKNSTALGEGEQKHLDIHEASFPRMTGCA